MAGRQGGWCNLATCPGICSRGPARFQVPTEGKVYLGVVTTETVLMVAVCAWIFAVHDPDSFAGPLYGMLGGWCSLSLCFFAWDAVWSENKFQLAGSFAAEVMTTFFVAWQVFKTNYAELGPVWVKGRYAVLAIKLIFQVLLAVGAWPTWRSFGHFVSKVAGAKHAIRQMYHRYRAFLTLIKVDTFASILLFILVAVYLLRSVRDADFGLGIASLVVSVIFFTCGWFAITHERKPLFWAFMALSMLQPAYIGYKFFSLYKHPQRVPPNVTLPQFFIVGSLCLLLRIGVLISGYLCYRDFGRGLRAMVFEGAASKHALEPVVMVGQVDGVGVAAGAGDAAAHLLPFGPGPNAGAGGSVNVALSAPLPAVNGGSSADEEGGSGGGNGASAVAGYYSAYDSAYDME